jgi:hypothetical protein
MTENTSTSLETYFSLETYGPYKMRTVVNNILKDLGIEKELPGPMFYTYCNKGYIKTLDEAKRIVSRDAAIEWTESYLTKLVAKIEKVQVVEVDEEAEAEIEPEVYVEA